VPLVSPHSPLYRLCSAPRTAAAGPKTGPVALSREVLDGLAPLRGELAGRRSARRFANRPVPVDLLSSACDLALSVDLAYWPDDAPGEPALGIAVAAASVEGLAPAFHRHGYRAGFSQLPVASHCVPALHEAYVEAPVLLLICGDLDKAKSRAASHSYERLLLRAGAVGYIALLSLRPHGISGCPFGASNDTAADVSRAAVGSAGSCHLFTIALGWPAQAPVPPH
jgi:hypothetical protein